MGFVNSCRGKENEEISCQNAPVVLFAVDGFCKFRLRGVSRVMAVSRQLSDSYVTPVVPTPARFCGHCGSPVQGDLCPNCGAQD